MVYPPRWPRNSSLLLPNCARKRRRENPLKRNPHGPPLAPRSSPFLPYLYHWCPRTPRQATRPPPAALPFLFSARFRAVWCRTSLLERARQGVCVWSPVVDDLRHPRLLQPFLKTLDPTPARHSPCLRVPHPATRLPDRDTMRAAATALAAFFLGSCAALETAAIGKEEPPFWPLKLQTARWMVHTLDW